jgi:hypothetical protein
MYCITSLSSDKIDVDHCYESLGGPAVLNLNLNKEDSMAIYCSKAQLKELIDKLQVAYDKSDVKR